MEQRFEFLKMGVSAAGVATVTLNRPPENALNREMIEELGIFFEQIASSQELRAVVLTGANGHFSSGADMATLASLKPGEEFQRFSRSTILAFDQISDLRIPVIAAIQGRCQGGGNGLAMACHFRVADSTATFGQTNVRLGLCPGFGGTQRLARRVGKSQALRLCLTGDLIDAEEAYLLGLVDVLVADDQNVLAEALAIATRIAGHSRRAVAKIIELVVEGSRMPWSKGWAYEAAAYGELSESPEFRESLAAWRHEQFPEPVE
ncbi:MAG: enoyl-CoA hydratase/isomerase family protein [Candidatus Sumerlaeia bacterium]|nr:enoyl-CoA hydratase/isomerase family protein [Candidatus Sumerlaeia bacterium]